MPELILDHFEVGAGLQRETGGTVPQIMQSDGRKPAGRNELAEVDRKPVRADRLPCDIREDVPASIHAEGGQFGFLRVTMPTQRRHSGVVQVPILLVSDTACLPNEEALVTGGG